MGNAHLGIVTEWRSPKSFKILLIMKALPIYNETTRLEALQQYQILDTEPEEAFEDIVQLAAQICNTPIALINFIDEKRQWFKAKIGLDLTEMPRNVGLSYLCQERREMVVISDTLADERLALNPVVTSYPYVRFYAGVPLIICKGDMLGTLCVIDHIPRSVSQKQVEALLALSRQVINQLELRLNLVAVSKQACQYKLAEEELKCQRDKLARSNAELEQFANVASHDLQEPLRVVASYLQLLSLRYKDKLDTNANEFIAHAVNGATRMHTLINDLLKYSRLSTDAQPFGVVDCNTVLESAIANLKVAIEESDAVITFDTLPEVMGDATQLTQLFQNLIGNAIKFRRQVPPVVHIGVVRDANQWQFEVRDNGIGMQPQYTERIFAFFQRLHPKDKYPGTGIGLAICKKIVERHCGRIWVESEAGFGATFYFTIPHPAGQPL